MKVIMLDGTSGCGKTSTLNQVCDDLINNHGATVLAAKTKLGGNPQDFKATLS